MEQLGPFKQNLQGFLESALDFNLPLEPAADRGEPDCVVTGRRAALCK
jgi:hypothetical protein